MEALQELKPRYARKKTTLEAIEAVKRNTQDLRKIRMENQPRAELIQQNIQILEKLSRALTLFRSKRPRLSPEEVDQRLYDICKLIVEKGMTHEQVSELRPSDKGGVGNILIRGRKKFGAASTEELYWILRERYE